MEKQINDCDDNNEDIYIPLNINNILITENNVINILNSRGVYLDKVNIKLFIEAFTHKSYCKKNFHNEQLIEKEKAEINNKLLLDLSDTEYGRLEFMGDRVIKLIVSTYLYHRYPNQDEGFMTRLQIKIEDKQNLAHMSKELGLEKYFIISKQIEQNNGRYSEKIHEDVFESFVGALYFSNGFSICLQFVTNLLETLIDYSDKLYYDNNYKDALMRVYHQNKWKSPIYVTLKEDGASHLKRYTMAVLASNGKKLGFGVSNTKKHGEQKAAKMALILLDELNEDQYTERDKYYPDFLNITDIDKYYLK